MKKRTEKKTYSERDEVLFIVICEKCIGQPTADFRIDNCWQLTLDEALRQIGCRHKIESGVFKLKLRTLERSTLKT